MNDFSRVWRAIQPRAKHAIVSTLEQQASRQDVGYRFLFAAMEKQCVAVSPVRLKWLTFEGAGTLEVAERLYILDLNHAYDAKLGSPFTA